jgi:hypothetical protein
MYEELSRLIEGRATDELSDMLMSLDATLVKAGFNMHREELDLVISAESAIDGNAILQSVVEVLRIAGDRVLSTFEITVTEDIPLNQLTSLIAAVAFYDSGDNDDAIDAIIKLNEPSDDTLREILVLVTEFSAEDYLPYITTVSDNLITKLEKTIAENAASTVMQSEIVDAVTQLRNNEARKVSTTEFSNTIQESGIPSGVSMENLYDHYTEHLLSVSVEQAVQDIVHLAMISSLSSEAIADETSFFIEDLYPSLEQNQQANILLRKELASLESLLKLSE